MAPGRGRGRGRGGRGRGRGRGGASRINRHPKRSSEDSKEMDTAESFSVTEAMSNEWHRMFLEPVDVDNHMAAQNTNKNKYLAILMTLEMNGVEVLQASKIRCLAAAWARHDHELVDALLSKDTFGVVEVLKAIQILDSGRRMREEEKKAAQWKQIMKTASNKGKSRIGKRLVTIKKNVHNLSKMKPSCGVWPSIGASGALARHVKRWTRTIPAGKLEFYAAHLPTDTWRQLADICHLNPTKDFPQLPWFLKYCFDKSAAPEGTLAKTCAWLDENNVNELVMGNAIPYAHIKQYNSKLTEKAKTRIATYTKDLDTLIWYYEDLCCPGVDAVLMSRLTNGETVTLPYGKLMERLLMLRKRRKLAEGRAGEQGRCVAPFYSKLLPYAERICMGLSVAVESPVVVIGDASASMDVAIETSTIIASFLRALTNAKLVFFSNDLIEPPFIPETIEQVLELAMQVKTIASTCHAAGLWGFYKRKEIVKTFIITTDEEENTSYNVGKHQYRFQELFKKYHTEVYPAKLVFVSFLHSQHSKGQMVEPLRAAGFDVMQFKLDHNRPDLTKLNNWIGQLALKSDTFYEQVDQLQREIADTGLQKAFDKLKCSP